MSVPLPKGWVIETLVSNPMRYRAVGPGATGPVRVTREEAEGDARRLGNAKCSACHDTGQLCGECCKPECDCARSYYRAPPYPCDACQPEPTR